MGIYTSMTTDINFCYTTILSSLKCKYFRVFETKIVIQENTSMYYTWNDSCFTAFKSTAMKKIVTLLIIGGLLLSCNNDDDTPTNPPSGEVTLESEINEFVWNAMNTWYLWQDEVNDLADDRFADTNAFFTFLNGFADPRELNDALLSPKDRFNVIVDDYDQLFNSFAGVATTNGVEFVLTRPPEGGTAVIGVVRYVINGSDAEAKGVSRGDIFYAINDTPLFAETDENGNIINSNLDVLNPASYTMNFATIVNDATTPNGVNIELIKTELTENPIHIAKTLDINGTRIGYIMYNSFISNFDNELNTAFGQLQNDGVTELVLDLRYNPGGSVGSAILLSSMITGQFTGQLFSRELWNSKWDDLLGGQSTFVNSVGGSPLNSLNLTKVYIIATDDSASASELVMNSLDPYIDVIHIGDRTIGKNEFSVTLVDNPDQRLSLNGEVLDFPYIFNGDATLEGVDEDHRYALQPLVGTNENAAGFSEFTDGLVPDIEILEVLSNLGTLGEPDEPLLARAIEEITQPITTSRFYEAPESWKIKTLSSSTRLNRLKGGMRYDILEK